MTDERQQLYALSGNERLIEPFTSVWAGTLAISYRTFRWMQIGAGDRYGQIGCEGSNKNSYGDPQATSVT
jgi:hypothetical protein